MKSIEEIVQDINESRKTLYILCGLPYAGKTYLAKEILAETACVYVSIDEIFQGLSYDWSSNKLPDKEGWEEIFNISYQKSQEALKNGSNVLYDSTNHTRRSRDKLRKIADGLGANTKVIYVEVPIEIIWKRWQENSAQKNRPVVDKNLVEITIKSFEAPTEDENLLIIKND